MQEQITTAERERVMREKQLQQEERLAKVSLGGHALNGDASTLPQ